MLGRHPTNINTFLTSYSPAGLLSDNQRNTTTSNKRKIVPLQAMKACRGNGSIAPLILHNKKYLRFYRACYDIIVQ
jgi:hypothetical protein